MTLQLSRAGKHLLWTQTSQQLICCSVTATCKQGCTNKVSLNYSWRPGFLEAARSIWLRWQSLRLWRGSRLKPFGLLLSCKRLLASAMCHPMGLRKSMLRSITKSKPSSGSMLPMKIMPCGCRISGSILCLIAFARISASRICCCALACCPDPSERSGSTSIRTLRSCVDLMDCLQEFPRRRTLKHESACPCCNGTPQIGVGIKRSQNDDARFWKLRPNRNGGVDAAHVREPEIHEGDIGHVFTKTFDRLASVGCLRDHQHVRVGIDDHGNPFAHARMIVDTENTYLVVHNRSGVPGNPSLAATEGQGINLTFSRVPPASFSASAGHLVPCSSFETKTFLRIRGMQELLVQSPYPSRVYSGQSICRLQVLRARASRSSRSVLHVLRNPEPSG